MSGVPSADLKAYFDAAERWDRDRLADRERSQRIAWTIAASATLLAAAAVIAVAVLAPLKTVEPFVVRVDRATGSVDLITGLKGEITPDEAVSKYFLAQYVRTREGWLAASASEDFRQVAILSAPAEQRRYAEGFRTANPSSPQLALGRDATAEVEIRAISFVNRDVASIRFRRTVRRAQAVVAQDWIATAAFTYARAPMREADRLRNPLGFQVTSYRSDPEVSS